MKKSISLALVIIMLFSIVNVSVFAASVATPKATSSNDVGGIKVYWNAVSGAVKYNVYRRVGGSSSWVLAGTTTGTQVIDKGVTNGKYYVYSVRAYNSQGSYSAYNQNMTYTTKCVATPKLTSLVNDTNGLKLTWGAVSGASYRVYRRGAGSTSWTYLGTVNGTTYIDSNATNGAYWRYTVRAVSGGYYSGFDTNGLYTMRLANPYSIKASQVQGGVNVTWAKINGATGYRVYRRGAGQTSWTYLGATTTNSFKDIKLADGTNYYRYTVRATRGNIYSGFYTDGAVVKVSQPQSTQPSTTNPSTTTPSTTEKPYFVSLELIKVDRPNSYNVDGMPVLDRVFGKNVMFQKGDTLTYKINMSNGGNTGFKLVGHAYCDVKINGNIITMKITGVDTSASFRLKVDTKTGTTEITEKVDVYWWTGKLNAEGATRQLIEDYAYENGFYRVNGQPNEYKRYMIPIPGNSNWFSEALAAFDEAKRAGCTKYSYQYVPQDGLDLGVYK